MTAFVVILEVTWKLLPGSSWTFYSFILEILQVHPESSTGSSWKFCRFILEIHRFILEVLPVQPVELPHLRKYNVIQNSTIGVCVELTMNWDQGFQAKLGKTSTDLYSIFPRSISLRPLPNLTVNTVHSGRRFSPGKR